MHAPSQSSDAMFEREVELEERELSRLLELLSDEQRVLTMHDDDQLLALAAEKSKHLAVLERLGRRRSEFLTRQGLRPDADGMLDWLAAHPERELAARAWRNLQENTRLARNVNEVNGALISDRTQRYQRRIALFSALASNDPTYSPDGFTRPSAPQRSLGEA